MPFVHLKLFGAPPAAETVATLQQGLTALMASPLRKNRLLTVVEIEVAADSRVSCGAEPLAPFAWTGRLIAFVTAGTNTPQQKAAFQEAAHALLTEQLGPPATPLYIIVQEVPGGDWGYGGLSQAARAQAAQTAQTALAA